MSWLLWILIGLSAGLLALALYYFNLTRRAERSPFPLDDTLRSSLGADPLDSPLDEPQVTPSASTPPDSSRKPRQDARQEPRMEPRITTSSEFDELGVGPVRLRPQDEAAAARLAAGRPQRTSRFSYKNAGEGTPLPVDARSETRREPHFDAGFDSRPDTNEKHASAVQKSAAPITPERNEIPQPARQRVRNPNQTSAPTPDESRDTKTSAPDVIPLYLVTRTPSGFAGSVLQPLFAQMGFEFGELSVYHHEDANGQILFSLMNGVAPGTFDPSTLAKQSTPALALFLRLPITRQPTLVLEQFLDLAYHMADALNASILDDRREELSTESVDRMRAIIMGD
ncbi:MAG: cell division protein ZipA C-terminal FtsZ-binding domain-containing protein [Halothiobacillaceae bacterium]|nr:cell division protein ZipA C-terminal FtsZ-binding domain-containing protein [Halothiobacillaceae bacterium]